MKKIKNYQIVHSDYVQIMKKRAQGLAPQMGCAVQCANIIKNQILSKKKKLNSLVDVGCATGHYYKTFSQCGISMNKYIGIDVDKKMIACARQIWGNQIKDKKMKFINQNIENLKKIEKTEVLICFNSFMYYNSPQVVLKKFIECAKKILIRSYFSYDNFRILRAQTRENNDQSCIPEKDIIDKFGNFAFADFWSIYSFEFIEKTIKKINKDTKIKWHDGKTSKKFLTQEYNEKILKRGATFLAGGFEISYPILQPWHILEIDVN